MVYINLEQIKLIYVLLLLHREVNRMNEVEEILHVLYGQTVGVAPWCPIQSHKVALLLVLWTSPRGFNANDDMVVLVGPPHPQPLFLLLRVLYVHGFHSTPWLQRTTVLSPGADRFGCLLLDL